MTGPRRMKAETVGLAGRAKCRAPTLFAQVDPVFVDLLDAEPSIDRVALDVPTTVDEDHALGRHVRVDQRLELERGPTRARGYRGRERREREAGDRRRLGQRDRSLRSRIRDRG